jgi:hypothetical protein
MTAVLETVARQASWPAWARYYSVSTYGAMVWACKPTFSPSTYTQPASWMHSRKKGRKKGRSQPVDCLSRTLVRECRRSLWRIIA